jgi:translation initiation factor 5
MESPTYAVLIKNGNLTGINKINIDGSSDPFYRYKMPQIAFQVVGNGKMVKTYILNVDDVSKSLQIDPRYISAYIGYETSSKFAYDNKTSNNREKTYISGDFSVSKISMLIEGLIKKIIICRKCKLPELEYLLKKKDISVRCKSCGEAYNLSNVNSKFIKYMVNTATVPKKKFVQCNTF